jgi:pyruvate formate lyase activating enzyme
MKYGNISSALDAESFNNSGHIASAFFYYGCNFRCGFCHNHRLLANVGDVISEETLYAVLRQAKRNWVSTIVVSGGEPTIDPHIESFLALLKKHAFRVKLDTNGSRPEVIEALLRKKLIDYIAMDIKGTLEQYPLISGWHDTAKIRQSVELVRSMREYEFRTTVVPRYHGADEIKQIGKLLYGSRLYVLQQFQPKLGAGCLDHGLEDEKTYGEAELLALAETVRADFGEVKIKCR